MQLGSGGAVILTLHQVKGRAMQGDQENSIFTTQKVITWLIIYSLFT